MSDGRRAYVTLVTSADYAIGAAALVRSLRLSQTEAAIVVLHTEAVGAASLAPLAALGARLSPAALLNTSDGFNERHARSALHAAAPFTKGRSPPSTPRSTTSSSCGSGSSPNTSAASSSMPTRWC